MKKKIVYLSYFIRICCLLFICSFTVLYAAANEQVPQGGKKMFTGSQAEYLQDSKYIESFRSSKDLEGLEKAAKRIQTRWKDQNADHYSALILDVCQTMTTLRVTGSRTSELLQGYAMQALKEADKIPLYTEISLVLYLIPNAASSLAEHKKAELRSSKTKLWLHAWHRLQGEIIVDFDFTDFPLLNVSPPTDANMPAGIAPEAIQDPKLRAEYEAAIEKNKQKAVTYNKQYHLRKLHKKFAQQLENYLIAAYSIPPYNIDELKQDLNLYVQDEALRNKILTEVTEAIQRNVQKEKDNNSPNVNTPEKAN